MYKLCQVYRATVRAHTIVGRFQVAAEDYDRAREVVNEWCMENGYNITGIRIDIVRVKSGGVPAEIFTA